MNKLRTDFAAIGGCLLLIVAAFLLLSYGRSHQVPAILVFGHILDALVFTGIVGNLIILSLVKLTAMKPLRVAFSTLLVVTAVPALVLTAIGGRIDPTFNAVKVVIGYAVSFLFWYGLHWLWSQRTAPSETA